MKNNKIIRLIFLFTFFKVNLFCQILPIEDSISNLKFQGRTLNKVVVQNIISKITYERVLELNLNQPLSLSKGVFNEKFTEHLVNLCQTIPCESELKCVHYLLWFSTYNKIEISNYQVFEYSGFPQLYFKSDTGYRGSISGGRISYFKDIMRKGLIGLNKTTHNIIFISGYMFLDDIKPIVSLDSIKKVKEYIELRYFNYTPNEIKIYENISDKTEVWVASFFSEANGIYYMLKIPIKEQDEIWELKKTRPPAIRTIH